MNKEKNGLQEYLIELMNRRRHQVTVVSCVATGRKGTGANNQGRLKAEIRARVGVDHVIGVISLNMVAKSLTGGTHDKRIVSMCQTHYHFKKNEIFMNIY